MAESPIAVILEQQRQLATEDTVFFRKLLYFFELEVPASVSGVFATSYLFPLMLGPNSYTLTEPFAVEKTLTQGGGLYVEENGIVQRMIKIRGHTGFKPRKLDGNGPGSLNLISPDKRSFGRSLSPTARLLGNLSGQRHFQFLQDAMFRTYADLKRDPATSDGVHLYFHNPKDEEHWEVKPEQFELTREASSPLIYNYAIDLLVVDRARANTAEFSEDKPLMDTLKSPLRMVNNAMGLIAGGLNDATALVDELTRAFKGVNTLIDDLGTIMSALSDFTTGVSNSIQTPVSTIESLGSTIDAAVASVTNLQAQGKAIGSIPDRIIQRFRQMSDAMDSLGTHPQSFSTPMEDRLNEVKKRSELNASTSAAERSSAGTPTSLASSTQLGTGLTQGDVLAASGAFTVGREIRQYTSTQEVTVEQGDTLVNLAARYLRDARLWQHIAVCNGLRPPFVNEMADQVITEESFPGALGVGSKILIPSYARPPQERPVVPVIGVDPIEPAENHFFGTDLKLVIAGGRPGASLVDVEIDEAHGATDVVLIEGVKNLEQALMSRLSLERGQDPLYTTVGLQRIVGLNNTFVDLELARTRIIEQLTADPRVASVRRLKFTSEVDALISDADVEVRGLSEPTNIRVAV